MSNCCGERESEVLKLLDAALELIGEPDCQEYPERDVYGEGPAENGGLPFWSEAGTYGRFGKEAARTLLARRRRLVDAAWALAGAEHSSVCRVRERVQRFGEGAP